MASTPSRHRLPGVAAARAREFLDGGREPVEARSASTVVILRDGVDGLEVYVHRRHRHMQFAAGFVAFPGGGVDPGDVDVPLPREAEWMRRLDVDDPAAVRGLLAAAVRELAEETGLVVKPEDLLPWAHWITPTFEPRRYDTWFFLLPLPDGAILSDVSGETDGVDWVRPGDELARADAGESMLMRPTRAVLTELAGRGSVSAAVAATTGRQIVTVLPAWEVDGDDVVMITEGEPE
jgi:8-oxo-dGTP pyrophosphatase MutT (NUDIX family)